MLSNFFSRNISAAYQLFLSLNMFRPKHFLLGSDARKLWLPATFFMFVEVFLLRICFLS